MPRTEEEIVRDQNVVEIAGFRVWVPALASLISTVLTGVATLFKDDQLMTRTLNGSASALIFVGGVAGLVACYFEEIQREKAKVEAEARKGWYFVPKTIASDLVSSKGRERIFDGLNIVGLLALSFVASLLSLFAVEAVISPELASFFNLLVGVIPTILKLGAEHERTKSKILADSKNRVDLEAVHPAINPNSSILLGDKATVEKVSIVRSYFVLVGPKRHDFRPADPHFNF